MKGRSNGQKEGTNWLVTGLIVAVAILLIILAASMSVLVRKKCKKRYCVDLFPLEQRFSFIHSRCKSFWI